MELPGELEAALQAIAESAGAQPSLFPALSPSPDALAADFDHWWRIVREERYTLEKPELRVLRDVSEQLTAMTTGVDRRNWTEEAMRSSPAWDRLRHLARVALAELGWTDRNVESADADSDTDLGPSA
jgi:hypothetical protein